MSKALFISAVLFSSVLWSQNNEHDGNRLYEHDLDENRWEEIRDNIRYEGQKKGQGPGRQWTYETKQEYERAKKNSGSGGGSGGGTGDGSGSGSGNSGGSRANPEKSTPTPRMPSTSPAAASGLSAIGYILLAVFIIGLAFLIYYMFVNAPKKGKKVGEIEQLEDVNPTEITMTELQRMLQEALARKDYRGAVRIYFIFIIKDLAEKNWIQWEKEKTNFQYLREMAGKNEYDDFNRSVSYFEIIWYGKRQLDEAKFQQIKPNFTRLLDKLGVK